MMTPELSVFVKHASMGFNDALFSMVASDCSNEAVLLHPISERVAARTIPTLDTIFLFTITSKPCVSNCRVGLPALSG